mgnify:CR=1 FL=1
MVDFYDLRNANWRDWQVDCGPIEGKKGERKRVEVDPGCFFKCEMLLGHEESARICAVFIGNEPQSLKGCGPCRSGKAQWSTPRWLIYDPRDKIPIVIDFEFFENGTAYASMFGKAVL